MANTLTVDQVSTILRAVLKQATGQTEVAAMDTAQLLTLGQKTLTTAYDPIINAITQVISRTIIAIRPYKRKFADMARDPEAWGNIVRKITYLERDDDLEDNGYLPLEDDGSVDMYKIKKQKAVELRFVGQQTYELMRTIFTKQLNTAFSSAAEFARFIEGIFTHMYNKVEKLHEETARTLVSGFIAGKISGDTSNVIHLLTEYNAATGLNLTYQDAMKAANFPAFMKWVYARIEGLSNLMTEYSVKFHTNLTDGVIMRHTPKENQRLYLYAPVFYEVTDRVLADTYHDSFLKLSTTEMVNFWQNIDDPDTIHVTAPKYLAADGSIATGAEVNQSKVFGLIFDEEAMGYSPIITGTFTTPFNAKGEYTNWFYKLNFRNYLDYTENGVVLLLD